MTGTAFFSEKVETKDGPKKHLYVIVAEKDMEVLAVPVTSWNNSRYCDNHCELRVGDHKFIKHRSWVDFSKARSYDAADLYNKIKDGTLGEAERFKKRVVDYIAAKTETSDNLPEKFLSFFDGNLFESLRQSIGCGFFFCTYFQYQPCDTMEFVDE